MIVEFQCPHCKTGLRANKDIAGPVGLCPVCNKTFSMPQKNLKETHEKPNPASSRPVISSQKQRQQFDENLVGCLQEDSSLRKLR
jgi:hypothetical protein